MLRPNVPPPPNYYADNLTRLLNTVAGQYSDILDHEESTRLTRVQGLSTDALRLFARLLTRKGPLFRTDALRYREVADTPSAVLELAKAELIQSDPLIPADRMLNRLTLAELTSTFPLYTRRCRGLRKEAMVATIAARYPEPVLHGRLIQRFSWVLLQEPDWLLAMRLLFFGGLRQDFSTFVLEDLGVIRHEPYRLDPAHRLFTDRVELARYFELRAARERIQRLALDWQIPLAWRVLEDLWPTESNRLLERQRGRLLNALGRDAERRYAFDVALSAYGRSGREPGRERRARILQRFGDYKGVARVLEDIEATPHSAGERHFARQFGARTGLSPKRIWKPAEQPLRLNRPPESVEQAALDAWLRNGGVGAHLENRFSLALLGLAFWDIVFAPVAGMFTHPYQEAPLDLYWSDFRSTRHALIDERFAELRDDGALAERMRTTYAAKKGTANALINWARFPSALLDAALRSIPGPHLLAMFDFMLDDLEQTRTGFPDLVLCYGPGQYRLVEVKGPGDQLRREQRLWFELFDQAGIPATVLRVGW